MSFKIIKDDGGTFGYGYLFLPITLLFNILLITAILSFRKKYYDSYSLLIINGSGVLFALLLLLIFII